MCGCNRGRKPTEVYVWTSDDGSQSFTYNSEVVAKAKVSRKGGSYVVKPVGT